MATLKDFMKNSVVELRKKCEEKGLSKRGLKAELAKRLLEAAQAEEQQAEEQGVHSKQPPFFTDPAGQKETS